MGKKAWKMIITVALVFLGASVSAAPGFAAGETVIWNDGIYVTDSEPDEKGSYFKLSLTVENGEVVAVEFTQWNKENQLTRESLQRVPIPALQEEMAKVLDEVDYYSEQIKITLDAIGIERYEQAIEGVYEAFQALWLDIIKEARVQQ